MMPLVSSISSSAASSPPASRQGSVSLDRAWILADDLTGACDAAVAFLKTGLSVRVWTGAQPSFSAPEAVQAVNTDSRALTLDEAEKAVSRSAAALGKGDRTLFFKKVDSTLRGPIAAELKAAQEGFGARAILFAPAFPAAGRTVRNGILEVEDISGRRDAIRIRDIFPRGTRDNVACVAGADGISLALERGKPVIVCDSGTQADLGALARAAQPHHGLLYAGSAGLAQAIAGLYASPVTPARIPEAKCTLVVCGTTHPVTELQIRHLDRRRFAGVELLYIRCEGGDEERVRAAFETVHFQAMVLTGGNAALLALRALGVHSLVLRGECALGIPWGVADGGIANGATVVTKSGGFGAASALNDILAMLAGRA